MSAVDWRDALRRALDAVRQARGSPPGSGKETFGRATQLVIGVRNGRLAGAAGTPSGGDADQPPLQRLNALLSLMASVEFPLGGYHAERMDAIERELQALGG